MKLAQTLYKVFNWVFVVGVVAQVLLAGLVVVAGKMDWAAHRDTGHIIGLPLILMLILMYVGKAGRQVKRTTWILFLVYILQADVLIFLRQQLPYVAAFHPVLALIDFWLGVKLLRMPFDQA
jgi:hypothetical protein